MMNKNTQNDRAISTTLSTVLVKGKVGCKKTKLGWIPEDWKIQSLEEIGEFSKGKGIAKKDILEDKIDGLPCVRYAEIYTIYHYNTVELKSNISKESAENSNPISYGAILFAGSGETLEDIGKSVAYLGNETAYAGGDIIILKHHNQDARYLGYLLNNDVVKNQLFKIGQGHSVVHIYASGLKKVLVALPSIPEQQKIAAILNTWDKAIAEQEKLIVEKQKLKKGLMQQLLTGRKRFPGFEEEWETKQLKDIGKIVTGSTPKTKNLANYGGNYLFVSPADMGKSKVIRSSLKTVTKLGFNTGRKIPKNSIVFVCIGSTIGKIGISSCELITNQQINSIIPNGMMDSDFVYYQLLRNGAKIKLMAGEQAVPMINKSNFSTVNLSFPKLKEQIQISKVLSTLDNEIGYLEREYYMLAEQKQGLMQQLLTGKKRVEI